VLQAENNTAFLVETAVRDANCCRDLKQTSWKLVKLRGWYVDFSREDDITLMKETVVK
jgi:hypothetical protein